MPATIRIDFDVNAKGISEALQSELTKIQGVMSSANAAMEAVTNSSIVRTAKKRIDEETKAARSVGDILSKQEHDIEQMRAGFSSKHWGNEKKAATAIVNEIALLQEKKDKVVRAMQLDGLSKTEQAQLAVEKKSTDRQLATMRRLALENKQIAEHGAGASVGIMGIGRNIEKNFDKAVGLSKTMQASLGVAAGFSLSGLVDSANKAKEQTEAMATVLRSANVPAEQIASSVQALKDHANEFADKMGLSRERAREVATEIVGMTGLTGKAAEQATDLALSYEKATGGVVSAEKFAKLLTKSIGDPENEKSLKLLEAKYPGIGAKISAAATEQEKLNILQQAASPAMEQMAENASGLFDRIQVGFSAAKDGIGDFIGANMDTIGAVGQTTATMLPLVAGFKQYAIAQKVVTAAQWLWNAAMTANPIGLVVAAVAALVGGMILLYNNVEPVRKAIDGMVSWVVQAYNSFIEWTDSLGVVGIAIKATIAPIFLLIEGIKSAVNWLGDLFGEEEKAVVSTNKVATANIAAAESSKKRAEAISEVIARLKEEKDANEATLGNAKALITDAYVKIAIAEKELQAGASGTRRAYLQSYIKDTEDYIRTSLVTYGKGSAELLEIHRIAEEKANAIFGKPKEAKKDKAKDTKELTDFDAINRELAERLAAFEWKLTEIRIKAEADRIAKLRTAKVAFINETTDYETYQLALKNAKGELKESEYQDKLFEIKLAGLKKQLTLLDIYSDGYREMLNSIMQLERDHNLDLAKRATDASKLQADAANKALDAFKNQVSEIQNAVSGYTDLIFKVIQLGSAEKKRNEEWDRQTDTEIERNVRLTNDKAKLAKTEAERNKILATGEKQREKMYDANEARQKKDAEEGEKVSAEQRVKSLINAAASMVQAVSYIIANAASMGPIGLIAAPATIAAAFGLYEAAKANLGFEKGGYTGKGSNSEPAGTVHKNEYVLPAGSFAVDSNGNLIRVNGIGSKETFEGKRQDETDLGTDESLRIGKFQSVIDRQTDRLVSALEKKSVVLNSQRMLLTNKIAQRQINRATV